MRAVSDSGGGTYPSDPPSQNGSTPRTQGTLDHRSPDPAPGEMHSPPRVEHWRVSDQLRLSLPESWWDWLPPADEASARGANRVTRRLFRWRRRAGRILFTVAHPMRRFRIKRG
jgi:hypothetical protein